ncbi:MAG: thiamine phosphate synthase [Candidatus Acidiferrales bacterium]
MKIICYVTDRRQLEPDRATRDLIPPILASVFAGVDWIQIREKDLSARELLAVARDAVTLAGRGTRVLINDRLDVALAAGAAGVHLGDESFPPDVVLRWCRGDHVPPDFLVGVSCHNAQQVEEAQKAGASYAFFGPIFETPSKAVFGPPVGIERLAEVCRAARIPTLAIGGINAENAARCYSAGAAGIAAIRLFQDAANLAEVVGALRQADESCSSEK